MAWFKHEASARTHFKFNRLAEALSIRRAEARGLFFTLCAWASEAAPDGRLDGYTSYDIEHGADWQGKKGRLVPALIDCGLLDRIDGGSLEIHDFFERAASHKQAAKKRAQRDRLRTVPGPSKDCPPGEDREDREDKTERSGEGGQPPPIETLRDAQVLAVSNADGRELYDWWQDEMLRVHKTPKLLVSPPTGTENAKRVLVNAGGDKVVARATITAFVESDHTYWRDNRWSLWLLAQDRDFDRARLSAKTLVVDDPEPKPWANDGKDWAEWRKRQDAKGGKR